jgi:hypothetical protein
MAVLIVGHSIAGQELSALACSHPERIIIFVTHEETVLREITAFLSSLR